MSEQDEPKIEKLEEEQAAGGPPQDELDAVTEQAPEAPAEDATDEPAAEDATDEPAAEDATDEPAAEAAADDAPAVEVPTEVAEEPLAVEDEDPETEPVAEPVAETAQAAPAAPAKPKRGNRQPEPAKPAAAAKPKVAGTNGAVSATVVRANAKYVRTSARKARMVCDHLRGKSVEEARAILLHTPRAVARDWSKLLESAVANAEHNHELDGDDLRILSITADEGPTIKRFRPRAMGRATKIMKRTSHLSIALTPKER